MSTRATKSGFAAEAQKKVSDIRLFESGWIPKARVKTRYTT